MANSAMRHCVQEAHCRLNAQAFGSEIEQIKLAGAGQRLDRAPLTGLLRGVEEIGPRRRGAQGVDLVLHQRDQRGNHHGHTVADQGRHW
jgi:hypothetical protein